MDNEIEKFHDSRKHPSYNYGEQTKILEIC